MPVASQTPTTMSNSTTKLPVVKLGPGRNRRRRSWLRRSMSSISGGRMPPPGPDPRLQGPFGPDPPELPPSDALFQGMLCRSLPWFPKVRRLYGQRRRGANLVAPSKKWRDGLSVQGRRHSKVCFEDMAHATRDEVLKALDQVIDPVSGRSVVQQDIVQGLVLRDGNVGFAVEVDAARGRAAEPLRKACEDAVAH